MSGVLMPCLCGAECWYADEPPQPQIALFIQPELRPVNAAVARIGDLAQPGPIRLGSLVCDDCQAALRTAVHVGRHRFRGLTIDPDDAATQGVATLGNLDDAVSVRRGPIAKGAAWRRRRRGGRGQSDRENGGENAWRMPPGNLEHRCEHGPPRPPTGRSGYRNRTGGINR